MVALNEDKRVMAWDLVKNRDSKTISRILKGAISRMFDYPKIIVIDDFSTYKKAVRLLKYNLIDITYTQATKRKYHNRYSQI